MVSVIVTSYNYGHFLEETLRSVELQNFSDWECIVVDSGSGDNTREVVMRFVDADKRFRYLFKKDEGVSSARNAGLKICKGEFVQFIDGDDQIQKNKISSQLDAFQKYAVADIVYGDVRFYDDGSPEKLRTSLKGDKPNDWLPKMSANGKEVFQLLRRYNFLVTLSPLIRRKVIEKVGGFDESIPALEDWDFWQRCALADSWFHYNYASDDFSLVRVHTGSLSKKMELMTSGNFILIQKRIGERQTSFFDKLFFSIKHVELFWNTFFSVVHLPRMNFFYFILSVLLFPLWLMIKLYRIIIQR